MIYDVFSRLFLAVLVVAYLGLVGIAWAASFEGSTRSRL